LPVGVTVVEVAPNASPADSGYDFLSMGYALRHVSDIVGRIRRIPAVC